ncbi:MAG: alpha/beta hydrolase-fold protein [Bacteroidota bacterium]|nr:esterase family protein [Candidatus Kapabacteria bacterium]MDW8220725.1 alpha/beta hydrolase-fold protein [Bacteroidota bacterium]
MLQPIPSRGKIIHIERFPSQYVDSRPIDIWLPDGYEVDTRAGKRFAVLYMHDGQMLFDSRITWNKQEWCVDETLSYLLDSASIRPCIVVGIWNNGARRHAEYFPAKPFEKLPRYMQDSLLSIALQSEIRSEKYLTFLVRELKPYIDSTFATFPDVSNTAIAGSSMGGLISLYALCEYPNVFGSAACLSTHWVGNIRWIDGIIPRAFRDYVFTKLPEPRQGAVQRRIYFDYGTRGLDSLYKPYQIAIDEVIHRRGYTPTEWQTREYPGEEHSERSWSKRLHIPLQFILAHPSVQR